LPHGDGEVSGFYGSLFRGESQLVVRSKLKRTLLCRDIAASTIAYLRNSD